MLSQTSYIYKQKITMCIMQQGRSCSREEEQAEERLKERAAHVAHAQSRTRRRCPASPRVHCQPVYVPLQPVCSRQKVLREVQQPSRAVSVTRCSCKRNPRRCGSAIRNTRSARLEARLKAAPTAFDNATRVARYTSPNPSCVLSSQAKVLQAGPGADLGCTQDLSRCLYLTPTAEGGRRRQRHPETRRFVGPLHLPQWV